MVESLNQLVHSVHFFTYYSASLSLIEQRSNLLKNNHFSSYAGINFHISFSFIFLPWISVILLFAVEFIGLNLERTVEMNVTLQIKNRDVGLFTMQTTNIKRKLS